MRDPICSREKCTLCMACVNSCPKGAIYLDYDEYGFEKTSLDHQKCVECGLCDRVCQRRHAVARNKPQETYAAQIKHKAELISSASGGAFQALAKIVLERNGICYGCTLEKSDAGFQAKHVRVDSTSELPRILNSKYIPSLIGGSFSDAKSDLETGRLVLFSGTPCQIQGLKAYLNKEYDNLLTADLICHGVTATRHFNQYIKCVEEHENIRITDYSFRDKSVSWGTNYCYSYVKLDVNHSRVITKHCPREESSYMMHYLRGNLFRENCYSCDLSCTDRVSDFTLGDYWEIEREHPEFVNREKPRMSLRGGISCILANTEKARDYLLLLEEKMILRPVTLESVSNHNGNLRESSRKGSKREWVLQTFPGQ